MKDYYMKIKSLLIIQLGVLAGIALAKTPECLDGDVRAHARDQLVETHLDRLREFVVVAGHTGRERF